MSERKRKTSDVEQEANGVAKHAKATKSAESDGDTMTTLDSGDPFLHALKDVQRAGKRAIALGRTRLEAINVKYYAGVKTGQDPEVVQGRNELESTMAELKALASEVASKVDSAPIYKLPDEIVDIVFRNLDIASLFSCKDTCQTWKRIFDGGISTWTQAPLILHGTLAETDSTWRRIRWAGLEPSALSLSIWQSSSDMKLGDDALHDRIMQTELIKAFPTNLREFKFAGNSRHHESKFWDFIADCPDLRILHWDAGKCFGDGHTRYDIGRCEKLCRLDEFRFHSTSDIRIDTTFVQMLSQVKRLNLVRGLGEHHVMAILSAAEDYLEDVSIAGMTWHSSWIGDEPRHIKTTLVMNQLQRFSLLSKCISNLRIVAPNATSVRFAFGQVIDWTLLDSCRSGLRSLHMEVNGMKTDGRFGQELFDMPQLEELHLDYRLEESKACYDSDEEESIMVSYRDFSAAAFWDAVLGDFDPIKASSILPKLRKLEIIHDPMLDESAILKYIEMRSRVYQPALKEVKILLANHCSDSTSRLDALSRTYPCLFYARYEEWKSEDTREWSLLTTLDYYDIKWDVLNACRSILKKLRIVRSFFATSDESLQQELFNMPQLEDLELDFKRSQLKGNKRSVFALWTSYSSGLTGKDDVALQDILPKLHKLKVLNDALLDEDVIIAMMDGRKKLGLAPIETFTVHLASKCADNFAKLESLNATMPGFTYKHFEDWGPQAGVEPDSEVEELEHVNEEAAEAEQEEQGVDLCISEDEDLELEG